MDITPAGNAEKAAPGIEKWPLAASARHTNRNVCTPFPTEVLSATFAAALLP